MNISPEQYSLVTRSIRLDDYVTSIRLEKRYWEVLDRIARSEGTSMPRYVAKLYGELSLNQGVRVSHGKAKGLASLIRLLCTDWLVHQGHSPWERD
jgi:predicted DNA-binding ribbon-helix-helix protein